jgi:hypothetical protein
MMKLRFLYASGILLALLFGVNGHQPGRQKPAPKPTFEYENECGVSGYTACVYRIVEEKAREAGKGMWQRANP